MGKLYSGYGFAMILAAARCFGSARVVIAGSAIAARSAAVMRGAGSIGRPIVGISRASRAGWTIVTASAPIVAGIFAAA